MSKINAAEWAERVKGPGKYEGEPAWVAFAWEEIVLDGCGEEQEIDGVNVTIVALATDEHPEIREAFPDAPERVALYCRDDGFVCQADLATVDREIERIASGEAEKETRERVIATLLALLQPGAHDRPELRKALGLPSWADLDDRLSEARTAVETILGE